MKLVKFLFLFIIWLNSAHARLKGYGDLSLLVFLESSPFSKVKVLVDNKDTYYTGKDGTLALKLYKGSHNLKITARGKNLKEITIPIAASEVTQAIITFYEKNNSYDLDLETPENMDKKALSKTFFNTKNKGYLTGTILDIRNNKPIPNAKIYVQGNTIEGKTNQFGRFKIPLPAGKHSLSIIHKNFSTETISGVEINSKKSSKKNILLTPSGLELEELVILAPRIKGSLSALLEIRRKSQEIEDVLGSEQISKAGDSDAASSLKRVTGLTLVDGKYVYVRGLGERYSSILLNGASIPSPDPTRRVIPLDLFPTGILEGIVIQKSYSADMPGEFGGGTIQLNTKSVPEKFTLKVSAGINYDEAFADTKMMAPEAGSSDIFGIDNGRRQLPQVIVDATKGNKKLCRRTQYAPECFSVEELQTFGKSFQGAYTPKETNQTSLPSLGLVIGNKWKYKNVKIGAIGTALYGNTWSNNEKTKNGYVIGETYDDGSVKLVENKSFDYSNTDNNIKLGGTANFGIEIGDNHSINATTVLVRKTTNRAQVAEGFSTEIDSLMRTTKVKWTERQLLTGQLRGSHKITLKTPFSDIIDISWQATLAKAQREAPDEREYRYELIESVNKKIKDHWRFALRGDGNQRIFSNLVDDGQDLGVDIEVPFKTWLKKVYGKVKLGFKRVQKDRTSEIKRYTFFLQNSGDISTEGNSILLSRRLEEILAGDNIRPDGFELRESTRATDNYEASQTINGLYGALEIPIIRGLKFNMGMRYENSLQDVRTFQLYDPDNAPVVASLEMIDLLPAYSLTYEFYKGMQVRLSYSETVSRPDFKELSPAPFTDDESGEEVVGNENLVGTVVTNIDFRWDYFFGKSENISLGGFYKKFKNPIESIIRPSSDGLKSFENAKSADNYGLEFEFRKNFDFLWRRLNPLSLAANLALIKSEISLKEENVGIQTSNNRPLQGQSPWVYNVQLGYDNPRIGTTATMLFNIFGERITQVGVLGAPDIKEQPFGQLDLVIKQKIWKGFTGTFKAKNILDPEYLVLQGDKVVQTAKKGRVFGFAVSGSF